jgi:hypothetical protein
MELRRDAAMRCVMMMRAIKLYCYSEEARPASTADEYLDERRFNVNPDDTRRIDAPVRPRRLQQWREGARPTQQ